MNPPPSPLVTVGAETVPLVLPASYAVRHEIVSAVGANPARGIGAALGVCWGGARLKARYLYPFEPLSYGAEVIDELIVRGGTMLEIMQAGGEALKLMDASLLTDAEVSASREGFPVAVAEGT